MPVSKKQEGHSRHKSKWDKLRRRFVCGLVLYVITFLVQAMMNASNHYRAKLSYMLDSGTVLKSKQDITAKKTLRIWPGIRAKAVRPQRRSKDASAVSENISSLKKAAEIVLDRRGRTTRSTAHLGDLTKRIARFKSSFYDEPTANPVHDQITALLKNDTMLDPPSPNRTCGKLFLRQDMFGALPSVGPIAKCHHCKHATCITRH